MECVRVFSWGIEPAGLQLVCGTVCYGRNFELGRRFSATYLSLEAPITVLFI
jgi:hypothetical protein